MQQHPALVAAFVHACWRARAEPELDLEFVLSSADIVHAMAEAVNDYSAHASISSDDAWFDVFRSDDTQ